MDFLNLTSSSMFDDDVFDCGCFLALSRWFWFGTIRLVDSISCCRLYCGLMLYRCSTSFIVSFVFDHVIAGSSSLLGGADATASSFLLLTDGGILSSFD
jgi:hypothetical protein